MFHLQNNPGRTAIVKGKEYLFFSGYSYLGMHHIRQFVQLVREGLDKYGWMFPSSRISNTQLDLFDRFEAKLSEITGSEDTVCFSSGFLAGRSVAELLQGSGYSCAPGTHPAICIQKTIDQDFNRWLENIDAHSVLAFDSVNPLKAQINDVSFLDKLEPTTCVIDDSHGIGIINNGDGISRSLPAKHDYLITYSLSKAFNITGGAVSCSKEMANKLRASSAYTASTSIVPAFAYAFLEGQLLYQEQRKKLLENITLFKTLTNNVFQNNPALPVFVLPSPVNEEKLEDAGFIISSFAYPDPNGKKIQRVVINALHTADDLERLAKALHDSHNL